MHFYLIAANFKNKTRLEIKKKKKSNLSVLKILAISGTRGSSGLGSQSREHTDSKTCILSAFID